jgi:hypothetical protein
MSEDWGSSPWMSDAAAWEVVLRDYYDQIKRQVIAALKRGAISPDDDHDPFFEAIILAVKLLQKHNPSTGKFEHYLAVSRSRRFRARRLGTDALDHIIPIDPGNTDLEEIIGLRSTTNEHVAPAPYSSDSATSDVPAYIRSLDGRSKAYATKLKRIVTDYCLLGVPMDTLVKRYRVSTKTVVDLIQDAPAGRGDVAEHLRNLYPEAELEERIVTRLPQRLHVIARMAILEGADFTEIARRTGRRRLGQRNHLRDRIAQIVRVVID